MTRIAWANHRCTLPHRCLHVHTGLEGALNARAPVDSRVLGWAARGEPAPEADPGEIASVLARGALGILAISKPTSSIHLPTGSDAPAR